MLIANRFERLEILGAGAMGTVYKGRDTHTDSWVAIKHLKPSALAFDPQLLERFQREGEILRDLNHPNIVKMIAAASVGDDHYLMMEYVAGRNLQQYLYQEDHVITPTQIIDIALDLADALTRAHRLDIIHRDIKPANILMGNDGAVKLTDFGVAAHGRLEHITETNVVVGTIPYLSPETCQNQPASALSDIWALGVVLFEMLTRQLPFRGNHLGSIIAAILTQPVPDLEAMHPDAPTGLVDLVYRMLDKNPATRIPSIRMVGAELEALLKGKVSARTTQISSPLLDEATVIMGSRFATPTPLHERPKHNIPGDLAPFVGRETELQELAEQLHHPQTRLISIIASGGMGKTHLAQHLALQVLDSFPNGAYFVALAPVQSPAEIVYALTSLFNLQQQAGQDVLGQVLDFVREKEMLLVMDNFEHLLADVSLVDTLLQTAPRLKILATSRERLNLMQEQVYGLSGLDFPDWETPEDALQYSAVQLFMQSAKRAQVGFTLQAQDLQYIARICRLVEGMPLGVVLAASWVNLLTPHEIVAEMERSFDFLESDLRNLPSRHRSMRAVFEYSWNLLSEREKAVFKQLSIFKGGFTREAGQQVTGASLRDLQALVNKSLIRRHMNGRFEIHELLRQYGLEQLQSNLSEYQSTEQVHCQYFADFIAQRQHHFNAWGELEALREIRPDLDNIFQAWGWAVRHWELMALRQFLRLIDLLALSERSSQAGDYVRSMISESANHPLDDTSAEMIGTSHSKMRNLTTNTEESKVFMEKGLAILLNYQNQIDPVALGFAYLNKSLLWQDREAFEQARQIAQSSANDLLLYWVYLAWAVFENTLVPESQIQAYFEQCLAISQRLGYKSGEALALHNVISSQMSQQNYSHVQDYTQQILAIWEQYNFQAGIAEVKQLLVEYYRLIEDYEQCNLSANTARQIYFELGDLGSYYFTGAEWAHAYYNQGNYTEALVLLDEALIYFQAEKSTHEMTLTYLNIHKAFVWLAIGKRADAQVLFLQGVDYLFAQRSVLSLADALIGLSNASAKL